MQQAREHLSKTDDLQVRGLNDAPSPVLRKEPKHFLNLEELKEVPT